MNIYDFDKTIYDGDSTLDFYFYCLKKYPKIIVYLPIQVCGMLLYMVGIWSKLKFKETFFIFVKGIDNIDLIIENFWEIHISKIKNWYKVKYSKTDIIISASPEFLLTPICEQLKVAKLIASKVDKHIGKFEGENCYGEEKVNRLKKEMCDYKIEEFYSDSLSDTPLAILAQESYIVDGDKFIEWHKYKKDRKYKFKEIFLAKEFILFILVGMINAFNGIVFAYIYSLFIGDNLGFIVGYITSLTISYILNSKITFKESFSITKYIRFCISYIPNFLIQNIVVIIFMNGLGWNKLIVYALAAVIGIPITFLIIKIFTFNNNDISTNSH